MKSSSYKTIETFYRKEARQMIGTYIKHSVYGVGKVIKIDGISRLVFFFEANKELHNGGVYSGSCENHHGWWFSSDDIKGMKCIPPLASLIERRQQ